MDLLCLYIRRGSKNDKIIKEASTNNSISPMGSLEVKNNDIRLYGKIFTFFPVKVDEKVVFKLNRTIGSKRAMPDKTNAAKNLTFGIFPLM